MIRLRLEDTAGAILAEIDDAPVPRPGEHVRGVDGVYRVVTVISDLVDGPLTSVTVLVENTEPGP